MKDRVKPLAFFIVENVLGANFHQQGRRGGVEMRV